MTQFNIDEEGWDLGKEKPEDLHLKDPAPRWAIPYIATPEAMKNYSDDLIYETDKRLREFIESMKGKWSKRGMDRRISFGDLTKLLGLDEAVKKRKNYNSVARVFAYYSCRTYKETNINGVRKKKVYMLSPWRLRRLPYSLRLRIEMLQDGCHPKQMELPKDDLEMGHARNPRTEANIERRKEDARNAFNEYQRRRRESLGDNAEE